MKGLLIETATSSGCLALCSEKKIIDNFFLNGEQNLSKMLHPALKNLLEKNHLHFKELDYIGCGLGPGSYTGTRVGAIVAKSLAFALDIPLIGVPSPHIYLPSRAGKFAYITDAKMQQYYVLKGEKMNHSILCSSGELMDPKMLFSALKDSDFIVSNLKDIKNFFSSVCFEPMANVELFMELCLKNLSSSSPPNSAVELSYFR